LQLTDALRAQAKRAPFHGVLSRVARYDTGSPVGFLEAAIAFALRDPKMGTEMREILGTFNQHVDSRS
jgi:UTP--glucose-1-phosphate uridylyltransferase